MEDKSRRPKHLRQPTWSRELAEAVLRLLACLNIHGRTYLKPIEGQMNKALGEWEHVYNYIRLHQALNFKTPAQYLILHLLRHPELAPKGLLSHMY